MRFVHDGDALALEYDGSGNLLRRYVHGTGSGADDPVAWYEGAGFTGASEPHLRPDWQGSITLVTDSAGSTVIAVNRFDEYGIPQRSNEGRFQYTGQAWLPELARGDAVRIKVVLLSMIGALTGVILIWATGKCGLRRTP